MSIHTKPEIPTIARFFGSLLVAAGIGACGGANDTEASAGATLEDDVAAYRELAEDVRADASAYGATMMGLAATSACADVHEQYHDRVRHSVEQLGRMSGMMDQYMNDHGGSSSADHLCDAATMMDEVDHHHSIACTFDGLTDMQSEAARHTHAMGMYADHGGARCDEMMDVIDGAAPMWGPMMQGCETWDGYCSERMHHQCCDDAQHHDCDGWDHWGDCDHGSSCG